VLKPEMAACQECYRARLSTWRRAEGPACQRGSTVYISDQGAQYTSELMIKHVCRMMDKSQGFSTAYVPETHGKVERFNRTFNDMLSKYSHRERDIHEGGASNPWMLRFSPNPPARSNMRDISRPARSLTTRRPARPG
jgi:transposase InsO family protein